MKSKILFALSLTLVLSAAVYAQTEARAMDKAKLDKFFDRLAEKNRAMGSLAVARDGKLLYTRAIGLSRTNGAGSTPSTVATRYRVGSIAKMFTASIIFQLVEEGKLKLTDTLDKFFPQIPNAGKITIALMLSHRSGIHSFTSDPDFRTWLMNPKTRDEIVAIIAKSKPDFEPGEKELYSNTAFVLLGYIVEKVGGKPYQEALKDRVTSKIGLKDTYLGEGQVDAAKNESYSFEFAGNWKQRPLHTDLSIPGGAGALISTPSDLIKFIQALFDGKIVSKESVDLMMQNGYGIRSYSLGDKKVYGHGGGIDGFNALLVFLPEEKLAVAYTSNGLVYNANNIVLGAFDIYFGKPFEIPAFETVAVKSEVLDKYTGTYASPGFPFKITIAREGEVLMVHPAGQRSFALEATDLNKFKFERAGIIMEFDSAKNQMTLKQGERETIFTKENQAS